MPKDLGFCEKDRRMHELRDFQLTKTRKDRFPVHRCKYCGELMKVHG